MNAGFAVFYFSEINVAVFGGDNINFVKISFVIFCNDGVAEVC